MTTFLSLFSLMTVSLKDSCCSHSLASNGNCKFFPSKWKESLAFSFLSFSRALFSINSTFLPFISFPFLPVWVLFSLFLFPRSCSVPLLSVHPHPHLDPSAHFPFLHPILCTSTWLSHLLHFFPVSLLCLRVSLSVLFNLLSFSIHLLLLFFARRLRSSLFCMIHLKE